MLKLMKYWRDKLDIKCLKWIFPKINYLWVVGDNSFVYDSAKHK